MDEETADRELTKDRKKILREIAYSMAHRLTHKPANPYCPDCMRGKMREKKHYKGAFDKKTYDHWGQCLTGDHVTTTDDGIFASSNTYKWAFILKDLYSGLKNIYPMVEKDAKSTGIALDHFRPSGICS